MTTTADEELAFAGPGALAQLVRSRQVHPRELVELCLRRIEELNPRLNAFRTTMGEQALADAEAATDSQGPLAGVPVAIKDEMPVAGQVMTWGSRSYGPAQRADGEVVRRLRAAGAIPIGITNVPEMMIFPWTASDANGITRNPWDPGRTPGGSSGGSAAAVAAGMVPVATAADGGGSIRIPAACCGLVGMKPTRGRVSLKPSTVDWLGLTVYGALARTVSDSALLLDVLSGPAEGGKAGPAEAETGGLPAFDGGYLRAAAAPPGKLRIAVSKKILPPFIARLSADQRAAWESTAALLGELGHEVIERDPSYGLAGLEFTQTWIRGIYEASLHVPDRGQLEASSRQLASAGRILVPDRRRRRLLDKRPATTARIVALWDHVDVLLTPVLTRTAISAEGGYGRPAPLGLDRSGRWMPFNPAFNLTGQPAIALPAGFGADGLPLSVQLVGRGGAEDVLYSLAGQIEAARPWVDARPASAATAEAERVVAATA